MEAGPGCSLVCWVSLMHWESAAMPGTLVSDRFTATASLFVPSGGKPLEETGPEDNVDRLLPTLQLKASFSLLLEKSLPYNPARKV